MDKREMTVKVLARHLRNEQVHVTMRTHSLVTDHDEKMGGDDAGPTSGETLVGALASCTAVQVARYAKRKGYPVRSVEVKANYELGYEKIDGPIHSRAFLSKIYEVVEIRGALTPSQFEELKFVAEHCPIGETLRQGVKIEERVLLLAGEEPAQAQSRRALRLFDGPEQEPAAASAGDGKA